MSGRTKQVQSLILSICFLNVAYAQNQQTRFYHPLDNSELAKEHFRDVHQDRQGLIWFGTRNGLVKFDGYQYQVFSHLATDPTSLKNDYIFSIVEDQAEAVLWVGTGNGFGRFNMKTEEFKNYSYQPGDSMGLSHPKVAKILQSKDGQIWLATEGGGLHQFDPKTETVTRFDLSGIKQFGINNFNYISQLLEDQEGAIWGSTLKGVFRLNRRTGDFQLFPLNLPNEIINAGIAQNSKGEIFVSSKDGVFKYDPVTTSFEEIPIDYARLKQQMDNVSWENVGSVFDMYIDSKNKLWLGFTGNNSALKIDLDDYTTEVFKHNPNHETSIGSTHAQSFMEDRDKRLWIGKWIGLSLIDRYAQKFNYVQFEMPSSFSSTVNPVTGIWKDKRGHLWMGVISKPINKYDPRTGARKSYYNENDNYPAQGLHNYFPYTENMIWVNSRNGTLAFDLIQEKYVDFPPIEGLSGKPESFSVLDEQTMLLGHNQKFYYLDLGTKQLDTIPRHIRQLGPRGLEPLLKDSKGFIWVVAYGEDIKLVRYLPKTTIYFAYTDGINNYLQEDLSCTFSNFKEDKEGNFWFSCNGLYQVRLVTDDSIAVKRWQKENSPLISNTIFTIEADDHANIWFTTEMGISRFNPTMGSFDFFGTKACGQRFFDFGSDSFKDENGWIYFNGKRGVTWLHPDSIPINSTPPAVIFTSFSINNQLVPIQGTQTDTLEEESPLTQHIRFTKALNLSYSQNDFSFTFAALDYSQPEKNVYAYKLENYHEDWIDADASQRTASFTNIPPGKYTFKVKAANPDGVWNEEGATVDITILRPWWQTWWAYTLYTLITLASIYRIYRFQLIRKLEQAEARRAKEVQQKNEQLEEAMDHLQSTQQQLIMQEKMASLGQMTAGIAHEIKNPLNFVNNLAELSVEMTNELKEELDRYQNSKDPEDYEGVLEVLSSLQKNAAYIQENGQRADGIVSSMMDHANTSQGERVLTDLNALVEEYVKLAYHGYKSNTEKAKIKIQKEFAAELPEVVVNPRDIGRVLINLINNACDAVVEKASRENDDYLPSIQVSTRQVDQHLEIRIRDNGTGIPVKIRGQIFNPFFTTKPTGRGSTGLGLSISYDIITQGHQGKLLCHSEEGVFTEFVIALPIAT